MTTEIRPGWRKSSFSNNGGASCIEVNFIGDKVLLRDSKYLRDPANDPSVQPVISMPVSLWPAFCNHSVRSTAHRGEGMPTIDRHQDGWVTVRDHRHGTRLLFTPNEWAAFVDGINAGEFELLAA
ncbi:DUF397 domain-containing protein [Nocardia anaemiae]|uniref:DUF397 domain-containing protein n=1 Tax=Nocardia anaemiae TaxID=263910 RepID=UPI0007A4BAE7|nr:DUF397 domain-containing protein [Nocardia anaemiae]